MAKWRKTGDMKILLNNNPEVFESDALTVSDLLMRKNFTFKMLVIKINGSLVKKTEYETAQIREGDDVHVLHLISGG
jgi:sulfur carrier protein